MYKSDNYTILIRTVNGETGEIEVVNIGSGTQEKLKNSLEFWRLRSRFAKKTERVFLTFTDFSDYVSYLLTERKVDYKTIEKYAIEV